VQLRLETKWPQVLKNRCITSLGFSIAAGEQCLTAFTGLMAFDWICKITPASPIGLSDTKKPRTVELHLARERIKNSPFFFKSCRKLLLHIFGQHILHFWNIRDFDILYLWTFFMHRYNGKCIGPRSTWRRHRIHCVSKLEAVSPFSC
jgi:hypothetical protein